MAAAEEGRSLDIWEELEKASREARERLRGIRAQRQETERIAKEVMAGSPPLMDRLRRVLQPDDHDRLTSVWSLRPTAPHVFEFL